MKRIFVAIDLPEQQRTALAGLAGALPEARWVPTEQLHLTIRFLGDVDETSLPALADALAAVKRAPFPLTLRGVGHFPPGRRPRVLWVGLAESAPLLRLQQDIEAALFGVGIPPDDRRFSPHITVARMRETPPALVCAFEVKERAFALEPFTVTEFALYSSLLTHDGAIHTKEVSFPLVAEA